MRIERCQYLRDKGWYAGPWDSKLAVSIGYAHVGVDEPHLHTRIQEVYLIACGSCRVRVEQETACLTVGDVLIVEPGEAHTFLEHSSDYFHFVIHVPGLAGEEARTEKLLVGRSWLEDRSAQERPKPPSQEPGEGR